ncbi:ATP-binding protein (plasmid) [Paraburkholderia sp. D15]|uniref:hybrid sensor histidine kinase/response regulator n=1 Tax=Paraburkholderia sp. D15 TaxID=2880218 RepID=UPI0024789299|nr:ATP-binding protein [Paraburkholderia sp. D15]WGS55165.1 ATP-binding protein [Paraburkholderia sp. D15]
MKPGHKDPLHELAVYLETRRGTVLDRWLTELMKDPLMTQVSRLPRDALIDHLPPVYAGICAALTQRPANTIRERIDADARAHGNTRWAQGFQLDELLKELDLLRRCLQDATSAYFASAQGVSRRLEAPAHRALEDLFSLSINCAIRQFSDEQAARVADAIAQRDRALATQQESEERLRIAAAAAGLGIFEWDVAGQQAVWENPRMFEITGQRPQDGPLSGDEFRRSVVHPEDLEPLSQRFNEGKVPGHQVHAVFRIFRRNDQEIRTVEMNGRFRFHDDLEPYCFTGTLADVTGRVRAEAELKEADRRKDVFLATLAHELRNPLAPIRNAARFMDRRLQELPLDMQWVAPVIERQSQHLANLVDELLDVSRISTGKIRLRKEVIDLKESAERAVEAVRLVSESHHHRLSVHFPDMPVFVNGDTTRLTQIISNLLDNAVKYTDDGGEVRLRLDIENGMAVITVADSGVGIPAGDLPRIFDLFAQTDPLIRKSNGGLGIGLSVVRSIARMHGGSATATSAGVGKGSVFSVRLPTVPAPDVPSTCLAVQETKAVRQLKILVVDDNRDAAESLALMLGLDGHTVQTVHDGTSGVSAAVADSPDVVLLDIGLPDMNGYEVAEQILAASGDHPPVLVALTGFGTESDIARSAAGGFSRHLVKPVDPDRLVAIIGDIADSLARESRGSAPADVRAEDEATSFDPDRGRDRHA